MQNTEPGFQDLDNSKKILFVPKKVLHFTYTSLIYHHIRAQPDHRHLEPGHQVAGPGDWNIYLWTVFFWESHKAKMYDMKYMKGLATDLYEKCEK